MERHEDVGGGASRSTDPAAGTSTGTDVSLREHLTAAIENSRRECQSGIQHLEERFNTLENTIDKRFDGVNEFRGALSDLQSLMATSVDLKNLRDSTASDIKNMADRTAERAEALRDAINKLNTRMDLREGQESGTRLTTGMFLTMGGLIIAALGLIVVASNYFTG